MANTNPTTTSVNLGQVAVAFVGDTAPTNTNMIWVDTSGVSVDFKYWDSVSTTWKSMNAATSAFVKGGNSFGSDAYIGLNDNFTLRFLTNNLVRLTIEETGEVDVAGDLNVAGNEDIDGDLTVDGSVNVGVDLSVTVDANIGGDANINGKVNAASDLSAVGNASIGGDAVVQGDTTIGGNATIVGDLEVRGDINITGTYKKLSILADLTPNATTNPSIGVVKLVNGTLVLANTQVTSNSLVFLQYRGTVAGGVSTGVLICIVSAGNMVIHSINSGAVTINTSDQNYVQYWIIN